MKSNSRDSAQATRRACGLKGGARDGSTRPNGRAHVAVVPRSSTARSAGDGSSGETERVDSRMATDETLYESIGVNEFAVRG